MEQLALAYWQSRTGQPKAAVIAEAIKAKIAGDPIAISDHELANAIATGASYARFMGLQPVGATTEDEIRPSKSKKGRGHPI